MAFPPVAYPPLPCHIASHAAARPHHPAIIEDERVINYAALDDLIRRGASRLRREGVTKGDRVLVAVSNKTDLILSVLSCMTAGAPVMPVSFAEESIEPIARYFEPTVIVASPSHPQAAAIADTFRILPIEELTDAETGETADLAHDDIGLLILTSGTTQGQRRGTLLSHRALSGSAEYMNHRMGIDDTVRDLVVSPMEHGFGMGRVRCGLHAGGTVVVQSVLFSPAVVADGLAQHGCNMLSAPVTTVGMLLDGESDALRALSRRIRWIELGSSHLKPAHRRALLGIFPDTRVFVSYGLTEAIRCTFLEMNAEEPKIDSVGKATPWTRVRIVDADDCPLPPGEEGFIQVDGVNKASGYFRYPEAWQSRLSGDWLSSGDIGTLDEDGYLTFVGRDDDMINVGGLKVAPEEVETELAPLLQGISFSVARVPDPSGVEGFVPGLFIESETPPPVGLRDVRAHLRDRLPEFKIPRTIRSVPEFPRTETTRKIRRAGLTEIAIEAEAENIPKTTKLLAALANSDRRDWPAIDGCVTLSRRRLFELLNGGRPSARESDRFGTGIEWLKAATRSDDPDTGRLVRQCSTLFPNDDASGVAIGTAFHDAPIVQALLLKTLAENGTCLLLPPAETSHIAEDLGWIWKSRPKYALIDNARFAGFAAAEAHLRDSFGFPEFGRLCILGPAPQPDGLTRFQRNFGFFPDQLTAVLGTWTLRPLRPPARREGAQDIWSALCEITARVFDIPAASLSYDSTADDTPGWNSLGFVTLIMAVEEGFGIRLSPRDIMTVHQLGDLETVVTAATQP